MWLALQLYKQNAIGADQLATALLTRAEQTPPIGQLAVTSGRMTMHQLSRLLYQQADDHRRFGELAVALDMLTEDDVAALLHLQQERAPAVEELLVQQGAISDEELSLYKARLYEEPVACQEQSQPVNEAATANAITALSRHWYPRFLECMS